MNLTTEQKEQLLAGLRNLAATGPTDPRYGICWNLKVECGDIGCNVYSFVSQTSVSWPGREGSITGRRAARCCYPIDRTYDADGARLPLWEGEALTKRLTLMVYLESYLIESLGTGDNE